MEKLQNMRSVKCRPPRNFIFLSSKNTPNHGIDMAAVSKGDNDVTAGSTKPRNRGECPKCPQNDAVVC